MRSVTSVVYKKILTFRLFLENNNQENLHNEQVLKKSIR